MPYEATRRCRLCGRRINNNFHRMLRHVLRQHPGEAMEKLKPYAIDPAQAVAIGEELGKAVLRKLGGM